MKISAGLIVSTVIGGLATWWIVNKVLPKLGNTETPTG